MSNQLKVQVVPPSNKSQAEIEQELLDKDQEKKDEAARLAAEKEETVDPEPEANTKETDETTENKEQPQPVEYTDDGALEYFNKRNNTEFSSIEEIFAKPEIKEPEALDPAVAEFKDYRERTGRSLNDFFRLKQDHSNEDEDTLLRNFYADTKGLDASDVDFQLNQEFGFDREEDEPNVIRSKEVSKKMKVREAINYYNGQKEQYNVPLESSAPLVPEAEREAYNEWQQQIKNANTQQEADQKRRLAFQKSTDDLFNPSFEGFKYSIGDDKEVTYKVDDVQKARERQSDAGNFVSKHFENGVLKSSESYHKAMNAANDPDALFKFAYELGAANAIEQNVKDSKNINMDARGANAEVKNHDGVRATALNSNGGKGNSLQVKVIPPNNNKK